MKKFLIKRQVVVFFSLVILLSWTCLFFTIGFDVMVGKNMVGDEKMPAMMLAMIAGPILSTFMMICLTEGKSGIKKLKKQLMTWRYPAKWYLISLLAAPIITIITIVLLQSFSDDFLPLILFTPDKVSLIMGGIFGGLLAGLSEEIGWTAFLTPRLRKKYGILLSGLILGLVWGLWHAPLFAMPDPTGKMATLFLLMIKLFTQLPVFRVLMTLIYDKTGSLVLSILAHMMLTASTLIFQTSIVSGIDIMIFNLTWSVLAWILILGVKRVSSTFNRTAPEI